MKKLFMILTALLFMSVSNAAITNLQTYVDGTNVEFYWQCDTTLSKIYEVGILETAQYNYISYVGAYPTAFVVTDGWYGCSTDLVLEYGHNYSDYEGTAAAQYFPKEDWDASIDSLESGLTLKPGTYIVYVEGYDGNYDAVTEDWVYEAVEIADTTTDVVEVIETPMKSIKFINPKGDLMIYSNGKFYDQLGRCIK